MTKTTRFLFSFFIAQFFLCLFPIFAIDFQFQYTTGHSYRILSTVEQEVIINGVKSHDATIVNRISVTEREALSNGAGLIDATFRTSENSARVGQAPRYVWGQEYATTFTRSNLGLYTIDEKAFMPVVRNVPVFPGHDVQPGDTWTSAGEEAHDMRQAFNLKDPFKVPFTANYLYKGTEEIEGKTLHVILVNYSLLFETPIDTGNEQNIPILTMVDSNQTLYWDVEKGFLNHYTEVFRIILETTWGDRIEFKGSAQAEITDFEPRKIDEDLALVQEQIEDLGIEDATVHIAEEGITISLQDIQFEAESAILLDSELIKLQKIAEILSVFPDNDLLISGHTALAGTEEGRQQLSEDRASSVAAYFAKIGLRRPEQLFSIGFGAKTPIAPNDNPQNMARNRRVEITILDQ